VCLKALKREMENKSVFQTFIPVKSWKIFRPLPEPFRRGKAILYLPSRDYPKVPIYGFASLSCPRQYPAKKILRRRVPVIIIIIIINFIPFFPAMILP
jgi:hypothetical protein